AEDSSEAPSQDAPVEVLNTRAELDKVGTDMVAVGQTAAGGNVVVVTADSASADAEITQIAANEGFPDASVVKVDRVLSA
ncbi:hypothetical protein J8J21_22685, partial [Mycobacterium tuberculosis]